MLFSSIWEIKQTEKHFLKVESIIKKYTLRNNKLFYFHSCEILLFAKGEVTTEHTTISVYAEYSSQVCYAVKHLRN